jgi:hypothetical protein
MRPGNGQDKPRRRNSPGSVKAASEKVAKEIGLAPSTVRKIYYQHRRLVAAIKARVDADRVKMLADVEWYREHVGPFETSEEGLELWEATRRDTLLRYYSNGFLDLVDGQLVEAKPWT